MKHGGHRKGAGRKAPGAGKGLKRYCVYLDEITVTKARKLGKGQLSRGIRIAVTLCLV